MNGPLVIGIGHPFRGDDRVGLLVAEALAGDVEAIGHHGEGTDLIRLWQGRGLVVVVDCMVSGAAPGSIRVWDAMAADLPARIFPKGSHVFGLAEAVAMARQLGHLPQRLVVVGVEGARFALGEEISAAIDVNEVKSQVMGIMRG